MDIEFISDPKRQKVRKSRFSLKNSDLSSKKKLPISRFCGEWLKIFYPWLSRCANDWNKPFCKACQRRLDCNKCHLQRHARTSKHIRNLKILLDEGEEAARENFSLRQERSKYYQQKKCNYFNDLTNNKDSALETEMESTEEYIENTEAGNETYEFEPMINGNDDGNNEPQQYEEKMHFMAESHQPHNHNLTKIDKRNGTTAKKDRHKLLMQIQKDKNDLMRSFKELIGSGIENELVLPLRKEKNHVDLFFESVSSSVKALSPKLIAEAKMRVSQLICELELRALNESEQASIGNGAIVVDPNPGESFTLHQSGHVKQATLEADTQQGYELT